MSTIVQIRKARKNYTCPSDWAHDPTIYKGELYARLKITPDMIGAKWSEQTYHVECAGDDQ